MELCSETAVASEKLQEVEVHLPMASLDTPTLIANQRLSSFASVVFTPAILPVLHDTILDLNVASSQRVRS